MLTSIADVQRDVNKNLTIFFEAQIKASGKIDEHYKTLWQVTRDVAMAGGKRLRPYLTVLAYQTFGGSDYENILELAAAQELLHISFLIHDDICDHDFIRHGQLNIAGVFREQYQSLTNQESADHAATSAALLAGDLILSAAQQMIFTSGFDETYKKIALDIFDRTIFEVAGGQLLDLEAEMQPIGEVDVSKIARYKTASYTCIGPLTMGARMADASQQSIDLLLEFGEHLGTTYQLENDMSDIFAEEPLYSDIRAGKRTLIIQKALELAPPEQLRILTQGLGNQNLTSEQGDEIRDILTASGVKAALDDLVTRDLKSQQTTILKMGLSKEAYMSFANLLQKH